MGETPSEELLRALNPLLEKGTIEIFDETDLFFECIMENFPTSGTKIAWSKAEGVIDETASSSCYVVDCIAFLRRLIARHKIQVTEEVVVVGDGPMEFSVATIVETLEVVLEEVLYMPQHTYVIPYTGEWCLAFTMECNMTFGWSPGLSPFPKRMPTRATS